MSDNAGFVKLELKYLKMLGMIILYSVVFVIIGTINPIIYNEFISKLPLVGPYFASHYTVSFIFLDLFQLPFYILIFRFLKKQNLFKVCNFSRIPLRTIIITCIIGFGASLFTASIIRFEWAAKLMPDVRNLLDYLLTTDPITFIVWTILHVAIYREIFFRGIFFNEFKNALPFVIAVILQSLIEGMLYFQFSSLPFVFYAIIGAVIYALVYAWCKSIWAPIIVEFVLECFLYVYRLTGDTIFNKNTIPFFFGIGIFLTVTAMVYLKEHEAIRSKQAQDITGK